MPNIRVGISGSLFKKASNPKEVRDNKTNTNGILAVFLFLFFDLLRISFKVIIAV